MIVNKIFIYRAIKSDISIGNNFLWTLNHFLHHLLVFPIYYQCVNVFLKLVNWTYCESEFSFLFHFFLNFSFQSLMTKSLTRTIQLIWQNVLVMNQFTFNLLPIFQPISSNKQLNRKKKWQIIEVQLLVLLILVSIWWFNKHWVLGYSRLTILNIFFFKNFISHQQFICYHILENLSETGSS